MFIMAVVYSNNVLVKFLEKKHALNYPYSSCHFSLWLYDLYFLIALSSEDYADEFSESDDSSTQTPPEGERIVDACKPLDDQP